MCVGADGEVRVLTWVQWQSVMEIISIKKKLQKSMCQALGSNPRTTKEGINSVPHS